MRAREAVIVMGIMAVAAHAEPELRGTPSELTSYLPGIPRVVSISGEAEIKVQADRAYVKLKVESEGRSLQDALSKNATLRQQVIEELKKSGIPQQDISGSKFSSRPEYGIFSDKAKSYKIDNTIRVVVADESQLRVAAASIDAHADVSYDGVVFEDSKESETKQQALAQACEAVTAKRRLYEDKFGVKLKPLSFTEGRVQTDIPVELDKTAYDYTSLPSVKIRAYAEAPPADITQFGEIVYKAIVTADYQINAD
ncbi:MAG: SIMPL domain-containing protein [Kiritimatiellae bacterium]|nr:SIMPL domain-containing protein [Kiritimatiellia bacterium]